jgi:DNA-3-methyladenine glycosylase
LKDDVLPRSFYERNTITVAQELLGKVLVRRLEGLKMTGRIVETEAYRGSNDPASHAYRGRTGRNAVMFGPVGVAYVFIAYGLNNCLNVTTEVGKAGAVLIRAIQPVDGVDSMMENRPLVRGNIVSLTSGPGKLCQAMKITKDLNGTDFVADGALSIHDPDDHIPIEMEATRRIGITRATRRLWRYHIKGNRFVSRN